MTETKARFCDVCNKLVDKEQVVYGKSELEWKNKYYSNYWQSKTSDEIVCEGCWGPLWETLGKIKPESVTELLAWLVNPYEEEDTCE